MADLGENGIKKESATSKALAILVPLIFIVCTVITLVIVFSGDDSAAKQKDIDTDAVAMIARDSFDCDELVWISRGVGSKDLVGEKQITQFCIYAIGAKGEKEVFFVVPAYYEEEVPVAIDWPFSLSLGDITSRLVAAGIKCEKTPAESFSDNSRDYNRLHLCDDLNSIGIYRDYLGIKDAFQNADKNVILTYSGATNDDKTVLCYVSEENGVLKLYKKVDDGEATVSDL